MAHNKQTERDGHRPESERKHVAVYLRGHESDDQFSAEAVSIDEQRRACRTMAEQLGADIVDEYVDHLPMNDQIGKGAVAMTASVIVVGIDAVIVFSARQFSTDREAFAHFAWLLGTHGANLCFASRPELAMNTTTARD